MPPSAPVKCTHPKEDRVGFKPATTDPHELCLACGKRRYQRADGSWWPWTLSSTVADLAAEAAELSSRPASR